MSLHTKFSNAITGVATLAATLSLTEKITFILGVLCLVTAIIANYYSFIRNKEQRDFYKKQNDNA